MTLREWRKGLGHQLMTVLPFQQAVGIGYQDLV